MYIKLENVRDIRTGLVHSEAVVKEENAQYFVPADEEPEPIAELTDEEEAEEEAQTVQEADTETEAEDSQETEAEADEDERAAE